MRMALTVGLMLTMATVVSAADDAAQQESLFAGTLAQSIAAVLVFVILFVVLSKFAWGSILQGLQDREAKIKDDLERAQTAAKQAAETLETYHAKLAAAGDEAKGIIDKGRADAQSIAASLKEQAQKEIQQLQQRSRDEIQAAKEQAIRDIYAQAADLSVTVAQQILQREINAADQQQIIEQSLAALTK